MDINDSECSGQLRSLLLTVMILICLYVCALDNSSSFSWYLMKFGTLADIFPGLKRLTFLCPLPERKFIVWAEFCYENLTMGNGVVAA